jgi:hypothetical protein
MIVQTGIKWEDVNQILADKNIPLFFPVSPAMALLLPNADSLEAGPGSWSNYRGDDLHGLLGK